LSSDPHDLRRFLDAQASNYTDALAELRAGRKRSHWMWYVFPQYAGLGHSTMAQRYSIKNVAEADAYLRHPILGPRLLECAEALLVHDARSAYEILGSPDDLKLRSSATLFSHVSPTGSPFHRLLDKFFAGEPDRRTVELIGIDAAADERQGGSRG
jgi:uncharacterized protein (DUF1810 family)